MKDDTLRVWMWRVILVASVLFWGGLVAAVTNLL